MTEPAPVETTEERRQRQHNEMVETILQAARAVMRENGVADLNMQALARRVGMRAPSLYNYFPSKIAIYEAVFVRGMRSYCQHIAQLLATHDATWAGLERILHGHLEFALDDPALFQLLFERPVPGFVPSPAGLEESARAIELARTIVRRAIQAGTIDPSVPLESSANLLIAITHGMAAQHLANEPDLPAGSGRFGSLSPAIIDLLRHAWAPDTHQDAATSK